MGAKSARMGHKDSLSDAQVEALVNATTMTRHEIHKWHRGKSLHYQNG